MRTLLLAVLSVPAISIAVPAVPFPGTRAAERAREEAAEGFDHSHAALTELLREHVEGDRVDYRALAADVEELDAYLATLHAVTPEELAAWSGKQRYAFWIDVYNAHVLKLVVDHYPVESIRDLSGFLSSVFGKRFIPMPAHDPEGEGRKLSLDDVEHEILRPRFRDARVHAAVNCASVGCPPLRAEAYVADRLDEQLDQQMRGFLGDGVRNVFHRDENTIWLSKVFEWFQSDFERDARSLHEFLIRFVPDAHAADPKWIRGAKLRYLPYDWSLNDVVREGE